MFKEFESLRSLFHGLADLPASARLAAIDDIRGVPEETRSQLRRLLSIDLDFAEHTARTAVAGLRAVGTPGENGRRVGPFVLERELGRGGMGTVYLAHRDVPGSTQRVALKCLHPIGAADEFRRRFHSEIAVLAQLSHPHIARLIDAGDEADGRCWIAMEYIEGSPLLRYCDERNLSVFERLALFEALCQSVSAAHRSLVVHRDIKSSNVLVTDDGQLFLIDFGIARSLSGAIDVTQPDQRFLSPLNAAPEQIRGEASTTACDVYGLGVLLYELLCGMPPIVPASRSSEACRHAALSQIPLLANVRLRQLSRVDHEAAQRIARQRACSDAAGLERVLRGDLAQICAVALRKRPDERYDSVDVLREDVHRAVSGWPIRARGNDQVYRVKRWLQRHALAVALATVAMLMLLSTTAALWLQTLSLQRERDYARNQTSLVRQQERRTEFLTGFLLDAFEQADPSHTMGASLTAKQILDTGIEELRRAQDADPEARIGIAFALADVEYSRGLYDKGDELVAFSRDLLAKLGHAAPRLSAHQHYLDAIRARHEGRLQDIKREAEQGLALIGAPDDESGQRLWVGLKRLRADASFALDDYADMYPQYRELVASIDTLPWMKRADAWNLRVRLAWALEQTDETRAETRPILDALLREQKAAHAENTSTYALSLALRAAVELHTGNPHLARTFSDQSLKVYRKIYGDRHPLLAMALIWAGAVEVQDGDPKLAIQHFHQVLQMTKSGSMADLPFGVLQERATAYDEGLHDPASAERDYRAAFVGFKKLWGPEHSATFLSESSLAYVLIEEEKYDEAEALLTDALRHAQAAMPTWQTPECVSALRVALALVRHAQGRDAEAADLLRSSLSAVHWYPMRNKAVLQRARNLAKALQVHDAADFTTNLAVETRRPGFPIGPAMRIPPR